MLYGPKQIDLLAVVVTYNFGYFRWFSKNVIYDDRCLR